MLSLPLSIFVPNRGTHNSLKLPTTKLKKRPNTSAANITYPSAKALAKLMVGGGAVAVRRGNCDCSDSDTDDDCGANGDAADERGAHQWGRCDWRCCNRRNCSRLCECLYGNQAQDSSGSENFFHDQSLFLHLSGQKLVHCCSSIIAIQNGVAQKIDKSGDGR